jgi:hypothetical protein
MLCDVECVFVRDVSFCEREVFERGVCVVFGRGIERETDSSVS